MFFCLTLSEKTGTKLSDSAASTFTFKDIYWNDEKIVFKTDGITVDYTVDRNGTVNSDYSDDIQTAGYVNIDDVDFIIIGNETDDIESTTFHSFSHIADTGMNFESMASNWKEAYEYSNKKTIKINVRTLDSILDELKINQIDILSIDVEGAELKVLSGLNLSEIKPKIIVLENLADAFDFHSVLDEYGYKMVEKINQDEIFKLI
jgi:hypothetical protein